MRGIRLGILQIKKYTLAEYDFIDFYVRVKTFQIF